MKDLNKNFLSSKTSHLINGYLDNSSIYPLVFYFKKNIGSWILILKIMEYHYENKSEELNIEKLIDYVPRHLASRISLFNIINEAESRGILIKKQSNIDTRKKIIAPSDKFIEEYEKWLNEYIMHKD